MHIVSFIPDIFLAVKVENTLKQLPTISFNVVYSANDISEYDYLILDLEVQASLPLLQKTPSKVICFAPHVRKDLIDQAKALGCNHVYTRGTFFEDLVNIIKEIK